MREQMVDLLIEGKVTPESAAKKLVQEAILPAWAAYTLSGIAAWVIPRWRAKGRGRGLQRELNKELEAKLDPKADQVERYKKELVGILKGFSRRAKGSDGLARPQRQMRHRYAGDLDDLIDDLTRDIRTFPKFEKEIDGILDKYRNVTFPNVTWGKNLVLEPEAEKETLDFLADMLDSMKELRGKAKEIQTRFLQQAGAT